MGDAVAYIAIYRLFHLDACLLMPLIGHFDAFVLFNESQLAPRFLRLFMRRLCRCGFSFDCGFRLLRPYSCFTILILLRVSDDNKPLLKFHRPG